MRLSKVLSFGISGLVLMAILVIAVFYLLKGENMHSPAPTVNVPDSPWVMAGTKGQGAALFASCASCHMADGSGRSDGSVPRLAGKSRQTIIHALNSFRDGTRYVPAMLPFARALTPEQVNLVADYIAQLPTPTLSAKETDQ